MLYVHQGRWAEAEPLYQRPLAIREKAFGPLHPDTAQFFNNLGVLYSTLGLNQAKPLLLQALAIREKALGPNHPVTANSLNNLAAHFGRQDQYIEAEPLYRRGVAILQKALGPDHPDTVALNANHAACLEKLNPL